MPGMPAAARATGLMPAAPTPGIIPATPRPAVERGVGVAIGKKVEVVFRIIFIRIPG